MSDVIKISVKSKKVKAVVGQLAEEIVEKDEKHEEKDIINEQLEEKYKKGFQEGYEKAKEELEKTYTDKLVEQSKEFYVILSSFEEKLKAYENELTKIIINTSVKIAEKILEKELEEKSIIDNILKNSLSKILGANEMMIKLNPKDYDLLEKNDLIKKLDTGLAKIKIKKDENIKIGGCVVESEIGNVDSRISTMLEEIERQLSNNLLDENNE